MSSHTAAPAWVAEPFEDRVDELDEPRDAALVEHIVAAWTTAESKYWARRAAHMEAAKPRAGDYLGRAGRAGRAATWRRLDDAARACRARAGLADIARAQALDALTDCGGLEAAAAHRRPGAAA